ncbi:MAG: hypothetical protein V1776_00475 [Candidatus Diapherotrites archaeon]
MNNRGNWKNTLATWKKKWEGWLKKDTYISRETANRMLGDYLKAEKK